jgi:hypothetical protein
MKGIKYKINQISELSPGLGHLTGLRSALWNGYVLLSSPVMG